LRRTRTARAVAVALAVALVAAACAQAPLPATPPGDERSPASALRGEGAAVIDALIDGQRRTVSIGALVRRGVLAPGQDVRVEELGRDARTSHHLVTLRDREPLHRHDRHALLVVVLDGHGRMHVRDEERSVGEGSVLYVPPGVVHAFINRAARPAVAYVVYTPPFDGSDRRLVEPMGGTGEPTDDAPASTARDAAGATSPR